MYRARKPKVKGTRRKGSLKTRSKGKPGQAKVMTSPREMKSGTPQSKVKGMGADKNTHAGAGKGKPKGKAKVGVTNPLGLSMRKANRPMGNPLFPIMGGTMGPGKDFESRMRKRMSTRPIQLGAPGARQKRQKIYGNMATKPRMGMTSQFRAPGRKRF